MEVKISNPNKRYESKNTVFIDNSSALISDEYNFLDESIVGIGKNPSLSSYFNQRMKLLGVTPENNCVKIWKNNITDKGHEDVLVDVSIFRELPEGIEILVYTLDRSTIRIEKNGSRMKKDFSIVRLEKPMVKPDGSVMKYRLPRGAGTHPFFPPSLIDKYEKKTTINTLYLVEGYFKAFKANMDGVDIIGLSSITHMKETGKGSLHPDILKLMLTCNVKRMVWLTDGDALDITSKEITDGLDLSKRPKQFFASVQTFHNLLADYDVDKWFMHIDTDRILDNNKSLLREDVKGIDDLLITFEKKDPLRLIPYATEIIDDLKSFSKQSQYFQKFNITTGSGKVYNYFRLRDIKEFYLFHVERRPEIKGKEFIFNGTRYQYDEEKAECLVKTPGDAKLYFRVGDDYYKFIKKPNQYGTSNEAFVFRKKTTIIDDHGREFTTHIPKYEAFCNVPSHLHFEQVKDNCFNVYSPVDYQPEYDEFSDEECSTIITFLTHLFGEEKVSCNDIESGEVKQYSTLDIAFDYLQILYKDPSQKLPILCLVSRENSTGKTTFANFLRMMLGSNVAIVGNQDLQADFNAHWATKCVVICDETKIDKQHVIDKVKSLSTANTIHMNAKGRGQVELDCFIKFVLISNNEDHFISASDDDIRYWVIKVPKIKKEIPKILDLFKHEMPAFLSFLCKRKLATEHNNRMWFNPSLLKTAALKKLIDNSRPFAEKQLRHYLKEMFLDSGYEKIEMALTDIYKEVFNNNLSGGTPRLSEILKNMGLLTYHKWIVTGDQKNNEFETKKEAIEYAKKIFPGRENTEDKIEKIDKTKRYKYPRRTPDTVDPFSIVDKAPGRAFCFMRGDFVNIENRSNDVEMEDRPF